MKCRVKRLLQTGFSLLPSTGTIGGVKFLLPFLFLLTEMLYTCKTKSRIEMRDDLTIACYMK
jgi:hypothetical protein